MTERRGQHRLVHPEQRQEAAQVATIEETCVGADIRIFGVKVPTFNIGTCDNPRRHAFVEAVNRADIATPPASSRVVAPTPQAVKVPLTDDAINELWMGGEWYRPGLIANGQAEAFARAIEAAHGIHPTEGERG